MSTGQYFTGITFCPYDRLPVSLLHGLRMQSEEPKACFFIKEWLWNFRFVPKTTTWRLHSLIVNEKERLCLSMMMCVRCKKIWKGDMFISIGTSLEVENQRVRSIIADKGGRVWRLGKPKVNRRIVLYSAVVGKDARTCSSQASFFKKRPLPIKT
jgi:hypothetical protein